MPRRQRVSTTLEPPSGALFYFNALQIHRICAMPDIFSIGISNFCLNTSCRLPPSVQCRCLM